MLNNVDQRSLEVLIQQMETRAVAHIDMDCFYVQVGRAVA